MEVPEYIRKMQKALERTKEEVAKQRRSLQLDEAFLFASTNPKFANRHHSFRKLRNKEVMAIGKLMPDIPEGQEPTDDQSLQLHEAAATALAMASTDNLSILVTRDMEDSYLVEALAFVLGLIGWTKESAESLNWFHQK